MRTLAVALLLSVPLTAGDRSSLEKAVELFKSQDAGQREAGSQLAERELRRLLAPLLKAMEDDDPEMRRRARRSILSLVPGEVEKEKPTARVRANTVFRFGEIQPVHVKQIPAASQRLGPQRRGMGLENEEQLRLVVAVLMGSLGFVVLVVLAVSFVT